MKKNEIEFIHNVNDQIMKSAGLKFGDLFRYASDDATVKRYVDENYMIVTEKEGSIDRRFMTDTAYLILVFSSLIKIQCYALKDITNDVQIVEVPINTQRAPTFKTIEEATEAAKYINNYMLTHYPLDVYRMPEYTHQVPKTYVKEVMNAIGLYAGDKFRMPTDSENTVRLVNDDYTISTFNTSTLVVTTSAVHGFIGVLILNGIIKIGARVKIGGAYYTPVFTGDKFVVRRSKYQHKQSKKPHIGFQTHDKAYKAVQAVNKIIADRYQGVQAENKIIADRHKAVQAGNKIIADRYKGVNVDEKA